MHRLAILVLGLVLVGCASLGAPPTSAPTAVVAPVATPIIIYVTPAPTPQVIYVTPAPAPTPRVTARPVPTTTITDNYIEWLAKSIGWLETIGEGADEISSAGGPRQMRPAVASALTEAQSIQFENLLITPDPCFANAYSAWTAYINKYVAALEKIDYGLTEPVTLSDLNTGLDLLNEALVLQDIASDSLATVSCA